MATDTRVLIETVSGANYVVTDAATARRAHPGCRIVSYADGRAFRKSRPAGAKRKPRRTKRPPNAKLMPTADSETTAAVTVIEETDG